MDANYWAFPYLEGPYRILSNRVGWPQTPRTPEEVLTLLAALATSFVVADAAVTLLPFDGRFKAFCGARVEFTSFLQTLASSTPESVWEVLQTEEALEVMRAGAKQGVERVRELEGSRAVDAMALAERLYGLLAREFLPE